MSSITITTTGPVCGPVIFVTQSGAGSRDGSSWANALAGSQLQVAIEGAASCGGSRQVWVASGLYKPTTTTGPDSRTISFTMRNNVAIYGGFVGSETSLNQRPAVNPIPGSPGSSTLSGDLLGNDGPNFANSGENTFTVVVNPTSLDATAVLDGFVITGGNNNQGGHDNYGGGMYNFNSSPTLTNCSFQANQVSGGVFNRGGGMYNFNSSPTLTNCSFWANQTSGADNNYGGGMYNSSGSPTLTNCSFWANQASGRDVNLGGGMANFESSPRVTNCSFSANQVSGGSYNLGGGTYNSGGSPTLTNCVVFGNGDGNTFFAENGGTLTARYSLFEVSVVGYTDGGNNLTTTTSPFVDAAAGNLQLVACAPAINAGSNSAYTTASGPATDLAANPRFFNNGPIDMGAYEFQGTPSLPLAITTQPAAGSAVCAGASVTTSVSITGTGPYTYEWYKDGALLSPAQSTSSLSLNSVTSTDAGSYSVVVTGACNLGTPTGLTSTAFNLSVNPLPSVSLLSSGPITCATPTASLTATGGTSYTLTGGPAVQTSNTGTFTLSQAATYTVTVSNNAGCTSTASLSVGQDCPPHQRQPEHGHAQLCPAIADPDGLGQWGQ